MRTIYLTVFLAFIILNPLQSKSSDDPHYVGVKKCKTCHATDDIGNQYKIWEASKHAKAYETLQNDESKTIAKKWDLKIPPNDEDEDLW